MAYDRLMDDLDDRQYDDLHAIVTGSVSIIFSIGGKATIRGTGGATALVAQVTGDCMHTAEVLVLEKVVDLLENAHADATKLLMEQRRKYQMKHDAQPQETLSPEKVAEVDAFIKTTDKVLGAIVKQVREEQAQRSKTEPLDVRQHIVEVMERHGAAEFVSCLNISKAVTRITADAKRQPTYREVKNALFTVLNEPLPEFYEVQPGYEDPGNPGSQLGARRIR